MTDILSELERLEKEATPGPWTHEGDTGHNEIPIRLGSLKTNEWFASFKRTPYSKYSDGYSDYYVAEENAKLTAAMRNALPALIAELKAAREVVAIADTLAKYIEDEGDYRELKQAIEKYDEVTNVKS